MMRLLVGIMYKKLSHMTHAVVMIHNSKYDLAPEYIKSFSCQMIWYTANLSETARQILLPRMETA